MALMRTEVPFNYRTLVFAFLMGSVLSVPVGLIFANTWRPFVPPEWIRPYYFLTVFSSVLILPVWTGAALRDQPELRRMGFCTSAVYLVILIFGLFYPAL